MSVVSLFVANARTALKIALEQIGLKKGARILVPDFTCDVLLHPILQTGLTPVYYAVTSDLNPHWDLLESIAGRSDCHALIMIHYFGQPQDIGRFRSFCSRHNLLLLENNAHGYGGHLAGRPLGSYGDIGISSPRKLLGIPSGGVLHGASASSVKRARKMKPYPAYHPGPLLKTLLHGMPRTRRFVKGWLDRNKNWNDPRLYRETLQPDRGIDRYSHWRIDSANWTAIAERRRTIWAAWSDFAQRNGLHPVFPQAHPESCPWAMPAYARHPSERNAWLTWGARNGVPLFPWPSLPEDVILCDGDAMARWRTLICFPLDSTPNDLRHEQVEIGTATLPPARV